MRDWMFSIYPNIISEKRIFVLNKLIRIPTIHVQEMLNIINNTSKIKFAYHNEGKKNKVYWISPPKALTYWK